MTYEDEESQEEPNERLILEIELYDKHQILVISTKKKGAEHKAVAGRIDHLDLYAESDTIQLQQIIDMTWNFVLEKARGEFNISKTDVFQYFIKMMHNTQF